MSRAGRRLCKNVMPETNLLVLVDSEKLTLPTHIIMVDFQENENLVYHVIGKLCKKIEKLMSKLKSSSFKQINMIPNLC